MDEKKNPLELGGPFQTFQGLRILTSSALNKKPISPPPEFKEHWGRRSRNNVRVRERGFVWNAICSYLHKTYTKLHPSTFNYE